MGEIQGKGYELYRPGDMAWNEAKDNRRLIDKIAGRLQALEKRVVDLETELVNRGMMRGQQ